MARKRDRHRLKSMSDINITPLMDLTFLLLIVFMITAPMLEYGVDVSPPELNADVLDDPESHVITLNAQGEIVFEQQNVDLEALRRALQRRLRRNPEPVVLIRADEERKYREVMAIMRAVRGVGIRNVSLVTQAEEPE